MERKIRQNRILIYTLIINMENLFFEIIGTIAWAVTAIPSIPQIFRTIKTKDVEWLSTWMFWLRVFWGVCWITYWYYLNSWQMEFFNSIAVICSLTMIILIKKYSKKWNKKIKK